MALGAVVDDDGMDLPGQGRADTEAECEDSSD